MLDYLVHLYIVVVYFLFEFRLCFQMSIMPSQMSTTTEDKRETLESAKNVLISPNQTAECIPVSRDHHIPFSFIQNLEKLKLSMSSFWQESRYDGIRLRFEISLLGNSDYWATTVTAKWLHHWRNSILYKVAECQSRQFSSPPAIIFVGPLRTEGRGLHLPPCYSQTIQTEPAKLC